MKKLTKLMQANMAVINRPQGGLSRPSKMPGRAFNIPASRCKVGSLLRPIQNTVCSVCYGLKGRYMFPANQAAMERRYAQLDHPEWTSSMCVLIEHYTAPGEWFRFFDVGDLQSVAMLERIAMIARQLDDRLFWVPTREDAIVSEYLATRGPFPDNLAVRLSSARIDGPVPDDHKNPNGLAVSSVATDSATARELYPNAYVCPSLAQDNSCADCRACWNPQQNIVYLAH